MQLLSLSLSYSSKPFLSNHSYSQLWSALLKYSSIIFLLLWFYLSFLSSVFKLSVSLSSLFFIVLFLVSLVWMDQGWHHKKGGSTTSNWNWLCFQLQLHLSLHSLLPLLIFEKYFWTKKVWNCLQAGLKIFLPQMHNFALGTLSITIHIFDIVLSFSSLGHQLNHKAYPQ